MEIIGKISALKEQGVKYVVYLGCVGYGNDVENQRIAVFFLEIMANKVFVGIVFKLRNTVNRKPAESCLNIFAGENLSEIHVEARQLFYLQKGGAVGL